MTHLLKKRRAEKQLFAWIKKGKRQPAKEKAPWIKKDVYSKLRGIVAEGRGEVDVDVDEWKPGRLITSLRDSVLVSEG
jgi:hypothetical protein